MTNIKSTQHVPQTQLSKIENKGSQSGSLAQSQTQRHRNEPKNQEEGGAYRSNTSVFVSQNALEARIAALQDDARHSDQNAPENGDAEEPLEHVLILVDVEKSAVANPAQVKNTTSADRMTKTEALANAIASSVENATRGGPGIPAGPIAMTLGLDPKTGLEGVQVTLSDGVLSVVLIRGADVAGLNSQMAALNLAQILQTRFPTRQIKISENASKVDNGRVIEEPQGGETGFSHLFQKEHDVS